MVTAAVTAEMADVEGFVAGRWRRVPELRNLVVMQLAGDAGRILLDQFTRGLRAKGKEGQAGREGQEQQAERIIHYSTDSGCG